MNVYRATQNAIWPRRAEFHVLTYAEVGFAPINIHTRDSTLSKDRLLLRPNEVKTTVIPAKAGIQSGRGLSSWTPAFAGVTNLYISGPDQ